MKSTLTTLTTISVKKTTATKTRVQFFGLAPFILLALFALFALFVIAPVQAQVTQTPDGQVQVNINQVVATVDGEDIILADLITLFNRQPDEIRQNGFQSLYPLLLDQVISIRLFTKEAIAKGYEGNEEVVNRFERLKDFIIYEVYLKDYINENIEESQIEVAYNDWLSNNPPEQERNARHILVETENEAIDARARLIAGEAFEAVARQISTGPSASAGGDLGWFGQGRMVPAFDEAVFSLELDEISAPVQTQFGWHIIQVQGVRNLERPSFEDFKEAYLDQQGREIIATYAQSKIGEADVQRFDLNGQPMQAPLAQ